ncbi:MULTISPECIES: ATP-binding protein [Halomonadaceae]|jgi:two-component system sensor histidine kinase QseC|uniref:histidine kinase n=1 Tax=Vreelandella titanicae BH1 TaxID=1204738 RepID=L9UDU6_9GAMM|nr:MULTISPECIES: ATP-binding protein [Halomonas]NAO98239.1 two-component sensor histidine kinase [Halomonas sp. MG34]ELY22882.1 ATPase-like, ATP-binding domain [Halomonas titanicae BH1]MCE7517914.1 two-component sensor histidine kinase [Halomonas titanicae]NVE89279.1 two-component sensor histidine kinase [Halomonas titanicae]PKH58318.1 two-component sensor histidine kinase [Halomonas sp. Choline-3u-9]|tara:strand:+ start:1785 stop:3170 length:1386 start_codon:yes stop_codon:yes gene_type:complete
MTSIRQRTLGLALLVFGISMLVIGFISYRYAAHEIEALYDASLEQNARLLEGLLQAPLPDEARGVLLNSLESALGKTARSDRRFAGYRADSQLGFQLWERNRLLLRSANAPESPLADLPLGFTSQSIDEIQWRIYVLDIPNSIQRIVVSEREDVRGELIRAVALRTLLPDLIGLPLLTALLWWSIGWGLVPLLRMAEQIRNRDPHNLQPLTLSPLPQELDTIAGALNRLLERIRIMRVREKRFIADAAHELRTPLAVLDLHAQNALTADNLEDRQEALSHLRGGVARATRLVTQLLTLARLEPEEESQPEYRTSQLLSEVRETLAKLSPLAAEREQQLLLNADEQADWSILEEPGAIETLVQNLVGNAIQHSPNHSVISITLATTPQSFQLTVDDQGPGIPINERKKVVERFQRSGPSAGSGLGLSIVERLVTRHSGTLQLDDAPSGGLRVRIVLQRLKEE